MSSATRLLHGTRAVVTGGASGIGLSVAQRFCQEGAEVGLADVDFDAASRSAAQLSEANSSRVIAIEVDVSDEASLDAAVKRTVDEFGGVDCAVANAGILQLGHVTEMSKGDWQRVVDVNLTGVFLTCKAFARQMLSQALGGRIITTASLFARRGGVENGAYAATKFGVLGLTQCLAAELAPYDILVNAVCPGQVDTPMMQQLIQQRALGTGSDPDTVKERLLSHIPMRRFADTLEVADVYVFLASKLSRYVTGQAIVVDGGWEVG